MTSLFLALFLGLLALTGAATMTNVPDLPPGARTRWIVEQPEEILTWLTFDPTTVAQRLSPTLRFITVKEVAANGIAWAIAYLAEHPGHADWGISFLEIVRMNTFTIDGRSPKWPENGAAALWFARVAPLDPSADIGPGQPFLALDFWIPDRDYVAYMGARGHYATFGDVRLARDTQGKWHGSIQTAELSVRAVCKPVGPVAGGVGSAGMQVIIPPRSSSLTTIVRIAFAGHRIQDCANDSTWLRRGPHPLCGGIVLKPANYEYGYHLIGGAYSSH